MNRLRSGFESSFTRAVERGGDSERVARLILRIAEDRSPKLRYRVVQDGKWVPRLKTVLPEKAFAFGVRRRFDLQ